MLRSFYLLLLSVTLCANAQAAGTIDPALRYTAAMPDAEKQPAVQRTRH